MEIHGHTLAQSLTSHALFPQEARPKKKKKSQIVKIIFFLFFFNLHEKVAD